MIFELTLHIRAPLSQDVISQFKVIQVFHGNGLTQQPTIWFTINRTCLDLVDYDKEQQRCQDTFLPHSSNDRDEIGQDTVVQYSACKCPVLCFNEAYGTLAPEASSHVFMIEKVEIFFVINEHQLEFIDLLQDDMERYNMVHTGSSGTESFLLLSESCVNLLLYPVKDHFAEDFENDATT